MYPGGGLGSPSSPGTLHSSSAVSTGSSPHDTKASSSGCVTDERLQEPIFFFLSCVQGVFGWMSPFLSPAALFVGKGKTRFKLGRGYGQEQMKGNELPFPFFRYYISRLD